MDRKALGKYSSFLLLFLVLQNEFTLVTEDRPEPVEDSNPLQYQLKKIEEQALELEVNIRRATMEILESPSSQSESWRKFEKLQRRVRELQANLRAAIESRSSTWHSRGRSRFDGRGSLPPRVRSDPNIPSTLVNPDFGFDSLTKWQSMNASIKFKKKSKDIIIFLDKDLSDLEIRLRWIIREGLHRGGYRICLNVSSNHSNSLHSTDPQSEIRVPQIRPQRFDQFSSLLHGQRSRSYQGSLNMISNYSGSPHSADPDWENKLYQTSFNDDDLDDDLFPSAVNVLYSGPNPSIFLAQDLEGGTQVEGIHPHRIDQFSSLLHGLPNGNAQESLIVISNYSGSPHSTGQPRRVGETV